MKRKASALTGDECASLKRDNWTYGDYWILSDGYNVTVTIQKIGEQPSGQVTIPRHIFNRLIDFYEKEQDVP